MKHAGLKGKVPLKSRLCLLLLSTLVLGLLPPRLPNARGQSAVPPQTALPANPIAVPKQPPPPSLPASDWSPPTEPQLGPSQNIETSVVTDGTASHPSLELRAAGATSGTNAGATPGASGAPKWKVTVYVAQSTTFDDNIFISHSNKQSDVYFSITPDIAAGWGDFGGTATRLSSLIFDPYGRPQAPVANLLNGDYAYLDYSATATHFLDHDSQDAVDQNAFLSGQWNLAKLQFGMSAGFQSLSGEDVAVGTRTRRYLFDINLTASYELSDKTSFGWNGGFSDADFATQLSSTDWNTGLFADYQFSHKTTFGVSIDAGLRQQQSTPDQTYEQGQLQGSYRVGSRITLSVSGGLEIDQSSGSSSVNPIFDIDATYLPDAEDSISLEASEVISSSALAAAGTDKVIGVSIAVSRRIYWGFSLSCSVGYDHADYYQQALSSTGRVDDFFFIRPSLEYSFARGCDIELVFEHQRNLSTLGTYQFVDNSATLDFKLVF